MSRYRRAISLQYLSRADCFAALVSLQQAIRFLSAWQAFYKAAAATWPGVTAAVLIGDDDEDDALKGSDTEDSPAEPADSAPKEIVLNKMAGVRVKVPPPGHNRYLKEGDYIELPYIITAEQVREIVGKKDPHSLPVQRAIMSAGWNYLTALDTDGLFGAPVRFFKMLFYVLVKVSVLTGSLLYPIFYCRFDGR